MGPGTAAQRDATAWHASGRQRRLGRPVQYALLGRPRKPGNRLDLLPDAAVRRTGGIPALRRLRAGSVRHAVEIAGPAVGNTGRKVTASGCPLDLDTYRPGSVPQPRRPVAADGGEQPPVRAERHIVDRVGVAGQGAPVLAGVWVPQPRPVLVGRGEQPRRPPAVRPPHPSADLITLIYVALCRRYRSPRPTSRFQARPPVQAPGSPRE